MPILRVRPRLERAIQRAHDCAQLVVADAHHHRAAVVRLTGLQPLVTDAWEVRDVECHHDAPLNLGELHQLLVWTTVKVALLGNRKHVVPLCSQSRTDPTARHVRIK
jgi:hypothetical protein